ncbi:MAG: type III toxin-antitoxin system ToxN/AbiQ family toxin [Solobacterium sp.]|nr:type III toxin-antitoxin system ToxN/AbiQ family toxin [Solobacterium sp.]
MNKTVKEKLSIYNVDGHYLSYLHKIDRRVPEEHDESQFQRPFIGLVLMVSGVKYVIPLSSPKKKHLRMNNTSDFTKIDGGKLGAINFNNMFPVPKGVNVLRRLDLSVPAGSSDDAVSYINLLHDQDAWINRLENRNKIYAKAEDLRAMLFEDRMPKKLKDRCHDFVELENECNNYRP